MTRLMRSLPFLLLAGACNLGGSVDLDAGPDERDARDGSEEPVGDGDDAVDADRGGGELDGDGGAIGGAITLVVQHAAFVEDRVCDLDGDGLPDNVIADLGPPSSTIFALAMSTVLRAQLENGTRRTVIHIPWVEDVRGSDDPDTVLILFSGLDTDDPDDPLAPEDDFSGEEPFYATSGSLDACGEPVEFFPTAEIEHGELRAWDGKFTFHVAHEPLVGEVPEAVGTVDSGGGGGDLMICIRYSVADWGDMPSMSEAGDLSLLETYLVGGAPFGEPALLGLAPDLDLDGDGLERFELDEEGRIVACIDGDSTVIDGRDCWQDERMADGFALILHLELVGAVFAGREPGWEHEVSGVCEAPPEVSFWDAPSGSSGS